MSFLISPKLWALSAAVLRRGHGGDGRRRSLCGSRALLPGSGGRELQPRTARGAGEVVMGTGVQEVVVMAAERRVGL